MRRRKTSFRHQIPITALKAIDECDVAKKTLREWAAKP